MLNALTTRIALALRRIAGRIGEFARAALELGQTVHLQSLSRRGAVLQPVRVRARRRADRF